MKRLCIFAFYNPHGTVKPYVIHLLKELKQCSTHIIFVVNGILNDDGRSAVLKYTSDIYVRQDTGLDAGAYKDVICNYMQEDLSEYDEVVFCNDSFWGPFIPLKNIFDEMEQRASCDFWGLCYTENNFADHIPGMFLVFKKNIVEKSLIPIYMRTCIDETTTFRNFVIASYEIGLFDFLVRTHKMKFAYYTQKKNLDVYKDADILIKRFRFPILKRRIGEKIFFNKARITSLLAYIRENTSYDINLIVDDLLTEYGIRIRNNEIFSTDDVSPESGVFVSPHSYDEIRTFVEKDEFYIMGAGPHSMLVWWLYGRNNKNFLGFFVSDGQIIPNEDFFQQNIWFFSDIDLKKNILVAIRKPTQDVYENLKGCSVMYLSQ